MINTNMDPVTYSELIAEGNKSPFGPGADRKPKIAGFMEEWRPDNHPYDSKSLLDITREMFQDQAMG